MKEIEEKLYYYKETKYKDFISKIVPNINKETVLGVRTKYIDKITKEIIKENKQNIFLKELPHKYYEENVIHSKLISKIKDEDMLINEINKFIPYIDNWAVNDSIKPNLFNKNKEKAFKEIKKWLKSKKTYEVRLATTLLLDFFINDEYIDKANKLLLNVKQEDYYVKMAIAWYYSFALIKYFDKTIYILEERKLDKWTHNKTISKCNDSFRLNSNQKEYLKSLKY